MPNKIPATGITHKYTVSSANAERKPIERLVTAAIDNAR
jgi:hypothetical protein